MMVIKAAILSLIEGNKNRQDLKKTRQDLPGLWHSKNKKTSNNHRRGLTSYVTKTKLAWIESQIFRLKDKTRAEHILDYLMRIISGSASTVRKGFCSTTIFLSEICL